MLQSWIFPFQNGLICLLIANSCWDMTRQIFPLCTHFWLLVNDSPPSFRPQITLFVWWKNKNEKMTKIQLALIPEIYWVRNHKSQSLSDMSIELWCLDLNLPLNIFFLLHTSKSSTYFPPTLPTYMTLEQPLPSTGVCNELNLICLGCWFQPWWKVPHRISLEYKWTRGKPCRLRACFHLHL